MNFYTAQYKDEVLQRIIQRNSPIGKLEQELISRLRLEPDEHILRPSGELSYENASDIEIGSINFTEGNIFTINPLENIKDIVQDFYKQRGFEISNKHTDILENQFTSSKEYKYINMNAIRQDQELLITIGTGDHYNVTVANPFKMPKVEPLRNFKLKV